MKYHFAAAHAESKGLKPDQVFEVVKKANAAAEKFGKANVINASIGAVYDEDENFSYMKTAADFFSRIEPEKYMPYAPIAGTPDFQNAAIDEVFYDSKPDNMHFRAVGTTGGTGAIHHVFYNYTETGEQILIPDWCWANYRTIASEYQRETALYDLFDKEHAFSLESIKKAAGGILENQSRLVIVFNTPAHNPTGYSMSEEDWKNTLRFLNTCAEDRNKRIIILIDLAYIDYAGDESEVRNFMRLFTGTPENLLITFAYSMSKSYMLYGLRAGALVGACSSESVLDEFLPCKT